MVACNQTEESGSCDACPVSPRSRSPCLAWSAPSFSLSNSPAVSAPSAQAASSCNAADQYSECVALTPASGPPGVDVSVYGTGWKDQARVGQDVPVNVAGSEVARVRPDGNGTFNLGITIPSSASGDVEVSALIGNGGSARAFYGASPCKDVQFFGAHGVGEGGGTGSLKDQMGEVAADTWDKFSSKAKVSVGVTAVRYPKVDAVPFVSDLGTWSIVQKAVSEANTELASEVNAHFIGCPNERFILVGYSEGAWVIGEFLRTAGSATLKRVAGVVLYGDPQFDPTGILRSFPGLPAFGPPYVPPAVADRFVSYCLSYNLPDGSRVAYDPICQFHAIDTASCLASMSDPSNVVCPHFHYARLGGSQRGADFLNSIVH